MRTVVAVLVVLSMSCGGGRASRAPESEGRLQVGGAELWYNGAPIVLHGVNVGDPFLARANRPVTDYAVIAHDWGANVVRIGVHPAVWRHTDRDSVRARLVTEVTAAIAAGMFVIIDYHAIGWPDSYTAPAPSASDPHDLYDADFQSAMTFWASVSEWFGHDGRVAFELWNEPISAHEAERLGGLGAGIGPIPSEATLDTIFRGELLTPPDSGWRLLRPFWLKLRDMVRANSRNLIIVGGPLAAGTLRGVRRSPIADENVAYSWHLYPVHDRRGDGRFWPVLLDRLSSVAPVVLTEWGFDPGKPPIEWGSTMDSTYPARLREQVLTQAHIHWIAWAWHPTWAPAMLQSDWRTPTEFGRFVQRTLHQGPDLVRPATDAFQSRPAQQR